MVSRLGNNINFIFSGRKKKTWMQFVNVLKHKAIKLMDQENVMKWSKNKGTWEYTTKLGYIAKMERKLGRRKNEVVEACMEVG
jgi:hypothetical protein